MVILSLTTIYLVYLVFLIGFIVFSVVALFHLSEYGYVGDFSRTMMVIYLAIASMIMLGSFALLIALG